MKTKLLFWAGVMCAVLTKVYAQDTKIRFFGQPGFEYFYNTQQAVGSPYFRSGSFVLFVTSQLSEKASVAGELNAHYMVTTGAELEIERLYLSLQQNDYLTFRIGKMYTPVGYWNLNYNFGLILQPTITRPSILQPTHDGGFVNTRDVGVQADGSGITNLGVFYKLFVFNGIGKNGGHLGIPYQLGEAPGSVLQLGIEPTDGLKISASGMYQLLQKNYPNQFGDIFNEDVNMLLGSSSISYMNPDKKLELIAEYYLENKTYKSIGSRLLQGGFAYIGYKANSQVVPYVYVETTRFDSNDIYYPAINIYTNQPYVSTNKFDVGLRYKHSNYIVYKFEIEAMHQEQFGTSIGAKTQFAFTF